MNFRSVKKIQDASGSVSSSRTTSPTPSVSSSSSAGSSESDAALARRRRYQGSKFLPKNRSRFPSRDDSMHDMIVLKNRTLDKLKAITDRIEESPEARRARKMKYFQELGILEDHLERLLHEGQITRKQLSVWMDFKRAELRTIPKQKYYKVEEEEEETTTDEEAEREEEEEEKKKKQHQQQPPPPPPPQSSEQ